MFSIRIQPKQLEEAVNPALYEPGLVAWKERLIANKNGSRISAQAESNPGFAFPSDMFIEQGTGEPVVRIGDLSDMVLDTNSCVTIAPHYEAPDNSRFAEEVCFVAMTGATVGKSGFKGIGRTVLLNQRVVALKPRDGADAGFLFASLLLGKVRQQIEAYASGAAQPNISDSQILQCAIPRTGSLAAKYIGNKIRHTERMRTLAKSLQTEAEQFFSLPGMESLRIGEFKSFRPSPAAVDSVRLDPKFYDPGHFKLRALLHPLQPLALSALSSPVVLRWGREEPEFFYLEIGELDLGSGIIKPSRLSTTDAPSRATTLVQPGDVLISTVRPNRKNVGLVMEVEEALPIVASSGFAVLRFASREEAGFYLFWLRSDAATMQLMRWDAGSSYPAIDEAVPLKVLTPHYAAEVVREKGSRWYQSLQAQVLAERLTVAATRLVEALVEGKVTESELVAAQEASERGDDTADRALLRRLTRHGLDVAGQQPLFPDLDALYGLLAQTTEASA